MQVPDRILSAKKPIELVKELRADQIRRNPLNPRQIFREKDINKLCDSILEMGGIIVPLVVLKVGPDDYVLLDGERRLMAARKLKMQYVPANVISGEMKDPENLCTMFSIHMARERWDPASRALALGKLKEYYPAISDERLEQITGMTRNNIEDAYRILKFPKDIIERCLLEGEKGYLRPSNLIEMDKAIDVIDIYLPNFIEEIDREKFVRVLVEKRDKKLIRRNTDFRLIAPMFEVVPAEKVKSLLKTLFLEPDVGISDIYESVEALIAAKKFGELKRSCKRFLRIIRKFHFEKLKNKRRTAALKLLNGIRRELESKVEFLEAN